MITKYKMRCGIEVAHRDGLKLDPQLIVDEIQKRIADVLFQGDDFEIVRLFNIRVIK